MTTAEQRRLTDLELDQRVRDRLVASGVIKPEEIEAYLAGLPDLEAQAETLGYDQPAVGGPGGGHRADSLDDEDDDDDDDDDEGLE